MNRLSRLFYLITCQTPLTDMKKEYSSPLANAIRTNPAYAMGLAIEDLKALQENQVEISEEPLIRPCELEGVSNEPVLSNAQLTAMLVELTCRFNNLNHAHFEGFF